MKPFTFYQPESIEAILQTANDSSQYLAGGTNQMDLMKKHIYLPKDIIAIKSALSKTIDSKSEGVTLGAAATNSAVANNEIILKSYPLISSAILAGASPQIRNMHMWRILLTTEASAKVIFTVQDHLFIVQINEIHSHLRIIY